MHYQNDFKAAEFTLLGNLFLSEGKQGQGNGSIGPKIFRSAIPDGPKSVH